ncbi:MAG: hypothetical protein AAF587_20190 [Bacteroidota bacterium]
MTHSISFITETAPGLLKQLTEDSVARWGIMQPQHMVEHLSVLFYLSSKDVGLGVLAGPEKIGVNPDLVNNDEVFPRMIHGVGLKVGETESLRFASLDEAKQKFLKGLNGFFRYFEQHPDHTLVHPVFGPLTYEQWLRFHHKHITHHFTQFGLIAE